MSNVLDLSSRLQAKWAKLSDEGLADQMIGEVCPIRFEALRAIAHARGWPHIPHVVASPVIYPVEPC